MALALGALALTPTAARAQSVPYRIALRSILGYYVVAENGGGAEVKANRTAIGGWETFTLTDQNGGQLMSGDTVTLQAANGMYFVAEFGGGSVVNANRTVAAGWETFHIWKLNGSLAIVGGAIADGDRVALSSSAGAYVVAEQGGGAEVNANRLAIGGWETFTILSQSHMAVDYGILNEGRLLDPWEQCASAPGWRRFYTDSLVINAWRNLEPATIALFLSADVLGRPYDPVKMEVRDGASSGIGPGETLVEFANDAGWAKELYAWNSCQGKVASLVQPGRSTIVISMRLSRPAVFGESGPTTVVFRKPGFFGAWIDIAHFDPDTFWSLADGKVIRFTWVAD